MTRRMTAAGTAAVCAMLLATLQVGASAQSKTPTPTAKPAPAKAAPAKPAPTATKAAPAKAAPLQAAAAKVSVAPVELTNSITLTGCLEADGRKFMLTDLEGDEAPKSRSWKTGFVTKKPKDVEVTPSASLKLGDHIGHKVSVVGVRNGETHLQARSIKQLAASCS